jgi:5-formyltetrahydrofolate cyclo-ligase
MNPSADGKDVLRQRLRQELSRLPPEARSEMSAHIRRTLTQQRFWKDSHALLAFVPTRTEPDIWDAVLAASAEGRTIYLPRYDSEVDRYVPAQVTDLSRELRVGTHGIREPSESCPIGNGMPLDLILVPGVGFSPSGGRLGRGRGYYDRMLADLPGVRCGVAFDLQVISELPLEPHDAGLDYLVTPSQCLSIASRTRL